MNNKATSITCNYPKYKCSSPIHQHVWVFVIFCWIFKCFFIPYCHNCFLFSYTVGKSSTLQKCKLPRGGWISCEYSKSKLLYYDIMQLQDFHCSLRYGRVTITELWRKQNNAKCVFFASGFSVWNDWSTHFFYFFFLNQKPWYVLQKSFGSDAVCEWFAVNGLKHVKVPVWFCEERPKRVQTDISTYTRSHLEQTPSLAKYMPCLSWASLAALSVSARACMCECVCVCVCVVRSVTVVLVGSSAVVQHVAHRLTL